jgi:hypothetical protein
MRQYRQNFRVLFVLLAIFSVLGNAPVTAQSSDNTSPLPDIPQSVLINVYEEYGKKGFVEYTLSFPDGVIKESNRGKVGAVVKHPVRLSMLSSEYFANSYKTKRFYCDSIMDKKAISSVVGNDLFFEYDCDRLGQRIAYSSAKKQFEAHSILVVKDVSNNVTHFRIDLSKESIVDIAWDPSGRYIAVLSAVFSYSYNPLALLFTISGHPVGYRAYYLELYDINGNCIYQAKDKDIGTFSAGRGSGLGAIVWVDKEDRK